MKKGVVIEVNERFVTLMTPDGEFIKTKNVRGSYQIGEEISYYLSNDFGLEYKRAPFLNWKTLKVQVASVLAVILLLVMTIPIFNQKEVYAYMSIDINPSFELEINEGLHVLSIIPLNEDAKTVLSKINQWENESLKVVTQKIIDQTKMDGYLKENGEVLIATVIKGEEKLAKEKLELEVKQMEINLEKQSLQIKTFESDQLTREKAQKEGLSTGRYVENQMMKDKRVEPKEEKIDQPKDQEKEVSNPPKQDVKNINEYNQVKQPVEQKKESTIPLDQTNREKKEKQQTKQNETKIPPGQIKKEEKKNNMKENKKKEEKEDEDDEDEDEDKKDEDDDKRGKNEGKKNNNHFQSIYKLNQQLREEHLKTLREELQQFRNGKWDERNSYNFKKFEVFERLQQNQQYD